MIARMSKYDFVLYSREYQDFIERLRALALVDVTTSNWEPSDKERDMILEIEAHTKAEAALTEFGASEEFDNSVAPADQAAAYALYAETNAQRLQLKSEIAQLQKSGEEAEAWGEFSTETLDQLEARGVLLHYFMANDSAYEKVVEQWGSELLIELIRSVDGNSYFVVVATADDSDVMIDAQEIKRPQMTAKEYFAKVQELEAQFAALTSSLSACAKSLDSIEAERVELVRELQASKVRSSATEAADGALLVMTAWAEEETSAKVDALLDEYSGVIYIKSQPTPEDDTPVKLKNSWFPRVFEMIGDMYALPKYGSLDLTPLFAPFYMLFFAICLCDAGYGAVILAAGLGLYFKGGASMRQASWLSIMCGAAAVLFGFFANSFFGMSISAAPLFKDFRFINFQQDFFSISMMIGVFQILLGMAVNIVVCSRTFGFKYALGSLGWFLLIFSASLSAALSAMGITAFGFSSIPFIAMVVVSFVLMLFFNSPDKNIFANVGAGLWDTYNNITGLLSDVLSYIRLFAIGLSGGVLALVFNSLALGMTGLDAGIEGKPIGGVIVSIIGAAIILLIGHGINLFMSTISSFVHPMRLTFVEFFKNAGFEMATRKFDPLK
ncbi:MAG: V-type ATPase 116kDa subunit family protein [Rikenellaceae bacterium]